MTEKEQAMEIKDQQQVPSETTERTRDWPCFVPGRISLRPMMLT